MTSIRIRPSNDNQRCFNKPFLESVGGVGGDSWVIGAIDWTSLSLVGKTSSPSQPGGTGQVPYLGHTSLDAVPIIQTNDIN